MEYFLVRWLINSLAIFIVAHIVKGIEVSSTPIVLVIALVLGIINAFFEAVYYSDHSADQYPYFGAAHAFYQWRTFLSGI